MPILVDLIRFLEIIKNQCSICKQGLNEIEGHENCASYEPIYRLILNEYY